jgi:hypothetical protein
VAAPLEQAVCAGAVARGTHGKKKFLGIKSKKMEKKKKKKIHDVDAQNLGFFFKITELRMVFDTIARSDFADTEFYICKYGHYN